MNDAHLNGEIKAFWGDIAATQDKLLYERNDYARRLKNGLGEDIVRYLNTPIKNSSWWERMKKKVMRFIRKLVI